MYPLSRLQNVHFEFSCGTRKQLQYSSKVDQETSKPPFIADSVREALEEAEEAYARGDTRKAFEICERIIEEDKR